nr:hypothetical protein [Tanacetum cinerariifolium]
MSTMANTAPIVTTVMKTANNAKEADAALKANFLDFCEEHYEDILPVIMDKILREKRKEVLARLNFRENPKKSRRGSSRDRSHSKGRSRRRGSFSGANPRDRNRPRGIKESYSNTRSSYRAGDMHGYHARDKDHSCSMKRGRENESPLSHVSESGTSDGGQWKTRVKRRKPADEDDLTGDPKDHLEIFKAAVQVERWAMPTWCHMFNSNLIGAARVWFDELPPESIDGYKGLKAAFLAYFMHQKKYVKYPVKIHNIKQMDGETIEEFMEHFKIKIECMNEAHECTRISGFMHGVNNPELTKRLNEHVLKTVEEMMTATTAFIRGETVAASKKKVNTPWKSQDQSKRQTSERRSDFKNQPKDGRGCNKFTPLTRTPKEIFAAESGKFKPPPSVTPIEELVRVGKLSHFIKEIRQDRDQQKTGKKDAPAKDKAKTIYMIRPWQRVTWQKVTQSFVHVKEITFPPLSTNKGTGGTLVIEVEIGGHAVHRIYVDEGSSMKAWDKRNPSSTIHSSRNAQVLGECRIVTICSTIMTLTECAIIAATPKDPAKKAEACHENFKVAIHPDFLDQEITIGGATEKRGQASEHTKAIQVEVQKLVKAGILREVYYHEWLSNPVMVKKHDGVGLILTSPERTEYIYALSFQFTASNNEAKYEALIAGLRIAAQMGVLVEVLKEKFIQEREMATVVEEEGPTWMTPIIEYLRDETLPDNRNEASKLGIKAKQYELLEGILYMRSFLKPWLSQGHAVWVLLANHASGCTGDDTQILPEEIVMNNGKQFSGDPCKDWCEKLNIIQRFASVKHLQSNGLVERENKSLGERIKARLVVDAVHNDEELWLNLDLLYERRERTEMCEAKVKLKMKKYYNARVRGVTFRTGDFVYRSNDASHVVDGRSLVRSGKDLMRSRKHWEMEHTS